MLNYYHISLPLINEFRTSFGSQKNRDAIIFHYSDGEITSYGEMVSDSYPGYSYEFNDGELLVIKKYLLPILEKTQDPHEFMDKAESINGHNMAKASIEMMLHDYIAKKEGKPLFEYLGKTKGYADIGISIGMDKIESTLSQVRSAVKKGYKRIKVKVEKGHDIQLLKAIRDEFPDIPLSVDANQDYDVRDLETLKIMDNFNLEYIEQPFKKNDFYAYSLLKKSIETKICLDESIEDPESAEIFINSGIADVINLKPGRMGGLLNTLKVIEISKRNSVGLWVGGMLETGIGRSFNISLASLEDIKLPGDTSPNDKYFIKDITIEKFNMENGRIYPLKVPGIGVNLDFEFLTKVMISGGKLL